MTVQNAEVRKNMKKEKVLGNVLFWATLIAPLFSFSLSSIIGEADIFDVAGIIRYSWIMLLFIPIGFLSFVIGVKLKKHNEKYKKNFIIAFICVPLLIIFGSYRFIFSNTVSYDVDTVSIIEAETNIELPDEVKVATNKFDLYSISFVKIIDDKNRIDFEKEIKNNQLWQSKLRYDIKGFLPFDIQLESDTFEYFLFYNSTDDVYNKLPTSGSCEIIFLAYDSDLQRLIIIDGIKADLD